MRDSENALIDSKPLPNLAEVTKFRSDPADHLELKQLARVALRQIKAAATSPLANPEILVQTVTKLIQNKNSRWRSYDVLEAINKLAETDKEIQALIAECKRGALG